MNEIAKLSDNGALQDQGSGNSRARGNGRGKGKEKTWCRAQYEFHSRRVCR